MRTFERWWLWEPSRITSNKQAYLIWPAMYFKGLCDHCCVSRGGCKFCLGLCVYARRGLKRHRRPCCYFYLKIAPQTRQSTVYQGQLFSQHSMHSGSRENSPPTPSHPAPSPEPAGALKWEKFPIPNVFHPTN